MWLEESCQISLSLQENLKGLQQTQQTMHIVVEGPTTKKLVKEVQHVVAENVAEVLVMQVELGGLHSKIAALVE